MKADAGGVRERRRRATRRGHGGARSGLSRGGRDQNRAVEPQRVVVLPPKRLRVAIFVDDLNDALVAIDDYDLVGVPNAHEVAAIVEEGADLGIGPALSEGNFERHVGDILVESELGEGATFHFTTPPRNNRQPSMLTLANSRLRQ